MCFCITCDILMICGKNSKIRADIIASYLSHKFHLNISRLNSCHFIRRNRKVSWKIALIWIGKRVAFEKLRLIGPASFFFSLLPFLLLSSEIFKNVQPLFYHLTANYFEIGLRSSLCVHMYVYTIQPNPKLSSGNWPHLLFW